MNNETVTLYFREGSSDKVYTAELKKKGAGWVVDFAYGRRGSSMNTGTKTSLPVEYEKAKKIYDKLVAEKTGKGYTPGEDGTPYVSTSAEERDTGVRPQLLNEMSDAELERLIEDNAWGAQEKKDGRRLLVKKVGAVAVGINRKGLEVALADPIAQSVLALGGDAVIDGEAVGDTLHAFDLLALSGSDRRDNSYSCRYDALASLRLRGAIQLVPLAITAEKKRALLIDLRAAGAEGIVFKRLAAPYRAGRPDKGGDQLKYKFYATGSFVVVRHNQKRSVALEVLPAAGGPPFAIGNVTIPPNKAIPDIGAIVEIRYLYCFKGGSLYQPTYLHQRDDIELNACTDAQIKYKAAGGEEDEA